MISSFTDNLFLTWRVLSQAPKNRLSGTRPLSQICRWTNTAFSKVAFVNFGLELFFSKIFSILTVRSLKLLFELLHSFFLKSLMSGPLKIWFCQFACRSSLFFLWSAIAPKIKVCSRAIERFQRAMCPALLMYRRRRGYFSTLYWPPSGQVRLYCPTKSQNYIYIYIYM